MTLQDEGVTFLQSGDWHVQGHRGTNPVKSKRTVSSILKEGSFSRDQKETEPAWILAEKPAWIVENCLRSKNKTGTTNTNRVTIKEDTSRRVLGRAKRLAAKLIITAREGSSPEGVNPRQALKINMGSARMKPKGKGYPAVRKSRYTLDRWKCYLNSCASYHTFFEREYLRNIGETDSTMSGNCNAGTVVLKKKGWYKNFQVWLNEQGIVNLLSIPMLEEAGYKVSTHTDRNWEVTTPQGAVVVFKRDTGVCKGMPYIDLREQQEGHVMLETVKKNMEGFTKKEIAQAELSRVVQRRTGHPTSEHLQQIVSQQSLKNVPIRSADVANAKSVFGPHVAGLKGWTNRKRTGNKPEERVRIPESLFRLNKFVTIAADVLFVAGVPFFITHLRKIDFTKVKYLPCRTAGQLANALRKVMFIYA